MSRKLYDQEARIMNELSEQLAKVAVNQGGTLGLIEDVLKTLESSETNGIATDYSSMKPGVSLTDGNIPKETAEGAAPPPEDDPANIRDREDSRPEEKPQPDTPDPPQNSKGFWLHIGNISIGSLINIIINKKSQANFNLTWVKNSVFLILVLVATVVIWVNFFCSPTSPENELPIDDELPPVEKIFVTNEDIILNPNERYKLAAAVLPVEAAGATLSYVSMDTSIITVRGYDGVLQALGDHPVGGVQPVDIIIQAESGATAMKTVMVDFSKVSYDPPVDDINDFVSDFSITQKVRLVGDTGWKNYVDAEAGDKVEFRIHYKNTSDTDQIQRDVKIHEILPQSPKYIPDTITLYNAEHPNGNPIKGTELFDSAINIGSYGKNSNGYVCFTAEILGDNLKRGSNTLVSWAQGGLGEVTIQDYASVVIHKDE